LNTYIYELMSNMVKVGSRGFEPETIGYISRVSPFLIKL
jgi:hypothetical protein